MKVKPVIRGLISYVPGLLQYLKKKKGKNIFGGTDSARYCYSIWMRHLIKLKENYGDFKYRSAAEIGPGDSLGMGIMALITGAEKYYAFEVKKIINSEKNLQIFEELSELFTKKESIPDDSEFPQIEPKLKDYSFPEYLFKENFGLLTDKIRLNKIKSAIMNEAAEGIEINYLIPWHTEYGKLTGEIDILFTQAVMEHIENPEEAYSIMYKVLRDGGIISHEIDYSSHETHEIWNGHLSYGNLLWKLIMHGRPYDINRLPHSLHIDSIRKCGFTDIRTVCNTDNTSKIKIKNKEIRKRFSTEDLETKNAFIQAKKKS